MEDKIMNNTATSLSTSDQIIATLQVGGKTMASVCKTNFASIDDIVRFICAMTGRFMGLARLNIRNKTQGWSVNLALPEEVNIRPVPGLSILASLAVPGLLRISSSKSPSQ